LVGWITASIAKCGFTFSAVISGVYLGLALPVGLESFDYRLFLGMLSISLYFSCTQFIFVGIAAMANYEFKDKDSTRKIIGINLNMKKIAPWCGMLLIIAGSLCFQFELWPSVFS
jgi:hypothetical protein